MLVSRFTVGMSVTTVVLVGSSSIPKIYEIILAVPGVALVSVMACNVHRNLLFKGRQNTEEESGTMSSSFTNETDFFTRSYRREEGDNTGHIGGQNSIHDVSTDLDCAV